MAVFHTILHPSDFDAESMAAFRVARALAQQFGAKLVAFHVVAPPAAVTGDGRVLTDPTNPTPVDLWTDYRAAAADTPGVNVQYSAVIGTEADAARLLREFVSPNPTGVLIVMGAHERTGLSRLIWGNRAEQVVRSAPCSVLVVKEPAPGGQVA